MKRRHLVVLEPSLPGRSGVSVAGTPGATRQGTAAPVPSNSQAQWQGRSQVWRAQQG